jgi:hypothetical protein
MSEVRRGRRGRREVKDGIKSSTRSVVRGDVGVDELELLVRQRVIEVRGRTSDEVVDTDNVITVRQESVDQVGANETGGPETRTLTFDRHPRPGIQRLGRRRNQSRCERRTETRSATTPARSSQLSARKSGHSVKTATTLAPDAADSTDSAMVSPTRSSECLQPTPLDQRPRRWHRREEVAT